MPEKFVIIPPEKFYVRSCSNTACIATEASEMGLFKPLLVASMFKDEIRRRQANRLFETAERLAQAGQPMTDEEVMAEIRKNRKERRSRR